MKSVPTGSFNLNATKRGKEVVEDETSFAPRINKRSIQIASAKRVEGGKIEDHLLKQSELSKKKKAELEAKRAAQSASHASRQSDKYVL